MSPSAPKRRMLENEAVFRGFNEKVEQGLEELQQIAKEDGQEHLLNLGDEPLQFFCECSDENCRIRVTLKPSEYKEIHKRRDCFVVVKNHEVTSIEKVIAKHSGYSVVQKSVAPKNPKILRKTDVENV